MDSLLVALALGVPVALVVIAVLRVSTSRWARVWSETAEPFGLTFSRNELSDGVPGGTLRGTVRGREVVVRSKTRRNSHTVTVHVPGVQTGPFQLDLTRERFVAWLEKLLGARELETGDRRFDRAFYLHTEQPGWCAGILDETVRAGLLRARPDAVEVSDGYVHIGFSGFGRWHRRPLGKLPALLQGAIETALNLAESVETAKPIPLNAGATHRPVLAKAVGPLLGVLALGALWLGASHYEQRADQQQQDRLLEFEQDLELSSLQYQLLSLASERAHDAEQDAWFSKYADSPETQRLLRKSGITSSDEAHRARTQRTLEELRAEIGRVLQEAEEPRLVRQRIRDETLARARANGVPQDQVERVLAELGVY